MQCDWKQCRFEFLLFIFLFLYCRRRWAHMFDFCCCSNCRQSRWKLHGCDCTRKPIPTAQTLIWPKLWKWVSNIGSDTFRWMYSLVSCVLQCINGFAHTAHAYTHTHPATLSHTHTDVQWANMWTLTDWIFCMFLLVLGRRCRCRCCFCCWPLLVFWSITSSSSSFPHSSPILVFGCVLQPITRWYPFRRNAVLSASSFTFAVRSLFCRRSLTACNRLDDHQKIISLRLTISRVVNYIHR